MRRLLALLVALLIPVAAAGQSTPATGCTTAFCTTQPALPPTCAKIQATKYIKLTNAFNIDPYNEYISGGTVVNGCNGGAGHGALGCTGGYDYQPSLNPPSSAFASAEGSPDTSAVQSALNSCTSGHVVEIVNGTSGQNAIIMQPFSIPTGVGLWADAGIAVYASISPADYNSSGGNCGTISLSGTTSCGKHWITSPSSTGSFVGGYGIFYGRGWDTFSTGATTQSWYYQRLYTYCIAHGGAIPGSPTCESPIPTCSAGPTNCKSNGPNGFNLVAPNNFTMYNLTLRDAGEFQVNWENGNGFNAWNSWALAPFEVSNTDGWDPLNSTNGIWQHGGISVGDNMMAIKATNGPSSNISYAYSQTGAGIGLQTGLNQTNGVTNTLIDHVNQNGNLFSSQSVGFELNAEDAATINETTFSNICTRNENVTFQLLTSTGSIYNKILAQNITCLPSTAPYTPGACGQITFQGQSLNPIQIQMNNFQLINGATNSGGAMKNANIYRGPGTVDPTLQSQFGCGTNGVTCTGTPSSTSPYPCSNSSWSQLHSNLNAQLPNCNTTLGIACNNQTLSTSGAFTLQAVVQPTTEINSKEQPPLTASVNFYDGCGPSPPTGCTLVGTSALSGDGFSASYNVSSAPAGTTTYTACYPGDSFYSQYCFGSIVVTNGSPTAPGVVILDNVTVSGKVIVH